MSRSVLLTSSAVTQISNSNVMKTSIEVFKGFGCIRSYKVEMQRDLNEFEDVDGTLLPMLASHLRKWRSNDRFHRALLGKTMTQWRHKKANKRRCLEATWLQLLQLPPSVSLERPTIWGRQQMKKKKNKNSRYFWSEMVNIPKQNRCYVGWKTGTKCYNVLRALRSGGRRKKRHLRVILMNKYLHRGSGWKRKFLRVFFWLNHRNKVDKYLRYTLMETQPVSGMTTFLSRGTFILCVRIYSTLLVGMNDTFLQGDGLC